MKTAFNTYERVVSREYVLAQKASLAPGETGKFYIHDEATGRYRFYQLVDFTDTHAYVSFGTVSDRTSVLLSIEFSEAFKRRLDAGQLKTFLDNYFDFEWEEWERLNQNELVSIL